MSNPQGAEQGLPELDTHLVICSGMLRPLSRILASSAGCTVKHWMSVQVKEPQALRDGAAGARGSRARRGEDQGYREALQEFPHGE